MKARMRELSHNQRLADQVETMIIDRDGFVLTGRISEARALSINIVSACFELITSYMKLAAAQESSRDDSIELYNQALESIITALDNIGYLTYEGGNTRILNKKKAIVEAQLTRLNLVSFESDESSEYSMDEVSEEVKRPAKRARKESPTPEAQKQPMTLPAPPMIHFLAFTFPAATLPSFSIFSQPVFDQPFDPYNSSPVFSLPPF